MSAISNKPTLNLSTSYKKFLHEFFEERDWREGPPVHILDLLTPAERSRAEDELIRRLSSWRDSWPIIGLAHMRSHKALPRLYGLLPWSIGAMKAQIALAIWKIVADEGMLKVVLKCSRPSLLPWFQWSRPFKQMEVIYCLAEFCQPEAKARLIELMDDEDDLIAHSAKRALCLRSVRCKDGEAT